MTTTTLEEVRRRSEKDPKLWTFEEDFVRSAVDILDELTRIRFPDPRFWADPVMFFRNILGVEPWERQVEVMLSIRDNDRVATRSGHKVSKSHTIGGMALCFYCSFTDARVVLTSTTSRQVDQILWREIRMLKARSGICVECKKKNEELPKRDKITAPCEHSAMIDGEIGELARTGLKSDDFREIVGFTAREAEAVAGVSGANLIYFPDEASGIPQVIFEAIEGNRAGGAKVAMFSNPTKSEGEFFDAFHDKEDLYVTHTISSEETPNVQSGEKLIPGLATREWIEEKKQEWGEDSALYMVRVRGLHVKNEEGKIFSTHTIIESQSRHPTYEDNDPADLLYEENDPLFIGIDPAGASGTGDESAFSIRRGLCQLDLIAMIGLSEEAHLIHTLGMIKQHRTSPHQRVYVVLDREGKVGAKVYGFFSAYVAVQESKSVDGAPFVLVAVRASDGAVREPMLYDRARDELTSNLFDWIKAGGAVVDDNMLSKEMHVWEWEQLANGKLKVMPKKKQAKKLLGRSPDRYDATALSVWEPLEEDEPPPPKKEEEEELAEARFDPYANPFRR